VSANPPPLDPDLVAGLRRLELARVRAIAPEVLVTPRAQRWKPEDLLRTLVEAEIAARDESNARAGMRGAGFPVAKTLDEFNLSLSSSPKPASITWPAAAENLCLVGPAGTAKSHLPVGSRPRWVSEGIRVRLLRRRRWSSPSIAGELTTRWPRSSTRCCGPTW